jgi:hypothetical protein
MFSINPRSLNSNFIWYEKKELLIIAEQKLVINKTTRFVFSCNMHEIWDSKFLFMIFSSLTLTLLLQVLLPYLTWHWQFFESLWFLFSFLAKVFFCIFVDCGVFSSWIIYSHSHTYLSLVKIVSWITRCMGYRMGLHTNIFSFGCPLSVPIGFQAVAGIAENLTQGPCPSWGPEMWKVYMYDSISFLFLYVYKSYRGDFSQKSNPKRRRSGLLTQFL